MALEGRHALGEKAETMSEQEDPDLFNPPEREGPSTGPDVREAPAFGGIVAHALPYGSLALPDDPELCAITRAVDAMDALQTKQARDRVLTYLAARYLEEE
jgi:hypothetical protein